MLDFDKARADAEKEWPSKDYPVSHEDEFQGCLQFQVFELLRLEKRRIAAELRKIGDARPTDGELRGFWYRAACVVEDV